MPPPPIALQTRRRKSESNLWAATSQTWASLVWRASSPYLGYIKSCIIIRENRKKKFEGYLLWFVQSTWWLRSCGERFDSKKCELKMTLDFSLTGIIWTPHIRLIPRYRDEHRYLVMASDGLWDFVRILSLIYEIFLYFLSIEKANLLSNSALF